MTVGDIVIAWIDLWMTNLKVEKADPHSCKLDQAILGKNTLDTEFIYKLPEDTARLIEDLERTVEFLQKKIKELR